MSERDMSECHQLKAVIGDVCPTLDAFSIKKVLLTVRLLTD